MSMQDGQGLNDLIQKELHGIDSTQIQDTCQSLEERILAMLGSSEARNAQEPPEEEEQGDDNEKNQNLKKALKGAMETGGFSLRGGVLGNMWSRDLQRDDALRNNYEKCKGYKDQRNFRQAWCANIWDSMQQTKKEKTFMKESQRSFGDFQTIAQAVKEQGGGTLATQGIIKFVERALASGEVEKYIRVNEWTDRIEIALPKKGWRNETGKDWQITQTFLAKSSVSPTAAPTSTPSKPPKRKHDDAAGTEEHKCKKDLTKATTSKKDNSKLKELVSIKMDLSLNVGNALTILRAIETDQSWSWARSLPDRQKIQEHLHNIEVLQDKYVFWQALCLAKTYRNSGKPTARRTLSLKSN